MDGRLFLVWQIKAGKARPLDGFSGRCYDLNTCTYGMGIKTAAVP